MKTIILNQRKERDELMSRPYLIRKSIQDTDLLLSSHLIKLITVLDGWANLLRHY